MSYELDLAFDSDEAEFCRGFEAADVYRSAQLFAANQIPGPTLTQTVHATNAEMMLRIADRLSLIIRSEELGDGWLFVTFARAGHVWEEPVDGQLVASACGHLQAPPTDREIDGCAEIIVRNCPVCARELWWHIDQWRKV